MKKMTLQGKNSKRIPKEKLKKMEETLKDMEEIRAKDSIQLRNQIKAKIAYYNEERAKSLEIENKLRGQLQILKIKQNRIDGAIIALSELIKEEDSNK